MHMIRRSRVVPRTVPAAAATAVLGLGMFAQAAVAQPAGPAAQRVAAPPATSAATGSTAGVGGGSNRIAITARDYSFDAPRTLPTGISSFTLRNSGAEEHHAQFLRLNDGVTVEQFGQAAAGNPDAALALVSTEGGPGSVEPGKTGNEVFLDLRAGNYLLVCFIESPDGVPHIAKGMVQPIAVAPPPTSAQPPQSSATVDMFDFGFTIPQLRPGQQTLKITNSGPQPHELDIVKIPDDVTPAQLAAALQNLGEEPPFETTDVPGFQGIDKGGTGWLSLNLTAGSYVALCFIPDQATGAPHAALGMVQPFRVQ